MTLDPGRRLGPYEIISRIGAGAMGEVFRARDTRLGRDVAIKILPENLAADADRMRRFEQEARAAGSLSHPNLVTVHDVGSESGATYVVMEFLEGETLRDKVGDGAPTPRIPIRKAVDYSIQIANGLAAAHSKGVVHRDLKPDNIFITRDGRVKIFDFGLAKFTIAQDDGTDLTTQERGTAPGTVLGTVGYMSPEQVRGRDVDHRSDIFSLGVILYEMLSGQRAFRRASSVETMNAILKEDPPDLHDSGVHVASSLEQVMRRCLEKSPDERFESAHDLAFAMEAISGSGSQPAMEGIKAAERPRWSRFAVAILVPLAVAGIAAIIALRAGSNAATGAAAPKRFVQLTYSGQEVFTSLAPDGKTVAFSSRRSGNIDIYVQRVDGGSAIDLTKDSPAADWEPAFSPDGNWIAFRSGRDRGGIFVMGATGESVRRLTDFGFNPAWAPDGRQIAVGTENIVISPRARSEDSSLWVVDVRSGQKRRILKTDGVQPSWSPHGKRISYWGRVGESGQRGIWTLDPSAAKPETTIVPVTNDAALNWNPVWSPDGEWIYFSSDRNGTINLWRIPIDEATGKTRGNPEPVVLPATVAGHFSFARDTGDLAFVSINQTAAVWRIPFDPVALRVTGEPFPVLRGSLIPKGQPNISPDGQWLAFSNEGTQQDLYLMRSDGSEMRKLTNDPEDDRAPSFSPDGNTIYFYSQRTGRYDIWSIRTDGSGLRKLSTDKGASLWYPKPMPGHNALYAFNQYGPAIVPFNADGALGKPEPLPPHPIEGAHLAFPSMSPDGTMLAAHLANSPDQLGVWTWSFVTRTYERIAPDASIPQWLPVSNHVVLARQAKHLVAIDVLKKTSREIPQPVASFSQITIAPDGRTLYLHESTAESVVWVMR